MLLSQYKLTDAFCELPHFAWLTHWLLVMLYVTQNLVDIGSGNGLLPDGTKPLPEPMLTSH